MEEMQEFYHQFFKENRGKYRFEENPKMTPYSFEVEELVKDKNTKPKRVVVMKSYFFEKR